jgi:hypothetical protein
MAKTIPQPPVTQEDLDALRAELRAEMAKIRREAATIRSFEDIWADTYPGYLASPSRPDLRVVTDESERLILKAARR